MSAVRDALKTLRDAAMDTPDLDSSADWTELIEMADRTLEAAQLATPDQIARAEAWEAGRVRLGEVYIEPERCEVVLDDAEEPDGAFHALVWVRIPSREEI